jgi:ectoine hydroxylase-related dioxygenase (phytanoyl-CoA dioxygenase family)
MKPLERVTADVTAERVADIVRIDGACIIENLVAPELLDQVADEVMGYVEKTPGSNTEFGGMQTRRTGGLAGRSSGVRQLIMHPLILAAGKMIMAEAPSIQINNTEIISIGPEETRQPLHRDQDVWAFPFPPGFESEFSVMWPITEFTVENGATRLVLGSHRTGRRDAIPEEETQQATMTKGSVLIWTGSLYHGGGANTTDRVRHAVNLAYCLGWLRQEENQYLAVPHEVAATLDTELLELMGYARAGLGLGNGVDRSDPMGIFDPELARPGYIDPSLMGGYGSASADAIPVVSISN